MEENGLSRIYGGWHYSFDNAAALEMGADVGQTVFTNAFTLAEPATQVIFAFGLAGLAALRSRRSGREPG